MHFNAIRRFTGEINFLKRQLFLWTVYIQSLRCILRNNSRGCGTGEVDILWLYNNHTASLKLFHVVVLWDKPNQLPISKPNYRTFNDVPYSNRLYTVNFRDFFFFFFYSFKAACFIEMPFYWYNLKLWVQLYPKISPYIIKWPSNCVETC